jgi:glycosyltransferase involved in cell wall biosynthesis
MPGDESSYSLDGIEVVASRDHRVWREQVERSDLVVAQLERQRPFVLASAAGKPFVFWFHIGNVRRSSVAGRPALTVFTSNVLRRQHAWINPSTVVHPPVCAADYLVERGTAATCVNLSPAKGGDLFFELARRVPDRSFLGVESWGAQVRPVDRPTNCTVLPTQPDMRSVYARTGVVLVPSVYEAYGRVAVEAAVSGIPTIAHPTAGVREAMGDAALWADREDPEAWVRHLTDLADPVYYAERSALARQRFDSLDPGLELDALADRLRAIVTTRPR